MLSAACSQKMRLGSHGKTCRGLHERTVKWWVYRCSNFSEGRQRENLQQRTKDWMRWPLWRLVATAKARLCFQVALWCSGGHYDRPHINLMVCEDLQAPRTGFVEATD